MRINSSEQDSINEERQYERMSVSYAIYILAISCTISEYEHKLCIDLLQLQQSHH